MRYDLSGDALGWGVNLSSNLKIEKDTVRLQVVYGEGIQNYMNDAPVDVAAGGRRTRETSLEGEALPITGIVAFFDHTWNDKWTSTIGYSRPTSTTPTGRATAPSRPGQYGLVNALYTPAAS